VDRLTGGQSGVGLKQRDLRRSIAAELEENLLPFWRTRSPDRTRGGFIAEMSNEGIVRREAAKGLILNARLLWTFSELYAQRCEAVDLELARRAYEYLEKHFRDREHGGYRWRVTAAGEPLEDEKKIYGQAFVVYALSSFARASGDPAASEAAVDLLALIERYGRDGVHGGYVESYRFDWQPAEVQRLSFRDMVAPKSMNTHLHLLEAYTGLYRLLADATVGERLRELITIFDRYIIDHRHGHLRHFFDGAWNPLSDSYTYGHDIESAWLLAEAAEVLGDRDLAATVDSWSRSITRATLAEGLDGDGGLAYEGRSGSVIDPNREWWCQAEAVVGFWHAFRSTGEERFRKAAVAVWGFIERRIVDRSGGEWFWRVFPNGAADPDEPKVSEWKGPYHNVRMCLEMLARFGNDLEGRG
jgi:mannobiose 2-epimerase